MRDGRTTGRSTARTLGAAAIASALALILATPPLAADRGHGGGGGGGRGGHHGGFHGGHGGRSAFVVGSPFFLSPFAWDWFYGYGWGYPPYGYRPEGGLDPIVARAQGLGGFDLNVKPRTAEVWVDGRYVGLVRDFDGYPSFLWLEEGDHTVAISKGGYSTWEREVSIEAGRVSEMKLDLAVGPSEAPPSD